MKNFPMLIVFDKKNDVGLDRMKSKYPHSCSVMSSNQTPNLKCSVIHKYMKNSMKMVVAIITLLLKMTFWSRHVVVLRTVDKACGSMIRRQ